MALFLRQIGTLIYKNLLIVLIRHPISTPLRCLILPLVYGWFLSYARNFFVAPSTYGIGSPQPILPLSNAIALNTGRDTLALVNSGFVGGDIDKILKQVGDIGTNAGSNVLYLDNEDDLLIHCRSTLLGTSNCFGAIIFYSSPTEGSGSLWNYTLRVDGSLGGTIHATSNNNDQDVYILPLQHTVDYAIANINSTVTLPQVSEFMYTSITQEQRNSNIRIRYNNSIINILGAAFFIGICGILYQQVGLQAAERESGISQLLESMMPNAARWQPQVARLAAYHLAFVLMFIPGWIGMAAILKVYVFARTSAAVVIVGHILTGLALASFGLFIGAWFRRAMLSGITAILIALILAVIAQVQSYKNGPVIALSLIFPSMNYTWFLIFIARWESQDMATNLLKAAPQSPWTVPGILFWIFLIIQILVYPVLAVIVERWLWGTSAVHPLPAEGVALELSGFSKHYYPNWLQTRVAPLFGRSKKEIVLAANDMNLSVMQGTLTVLVGANGCGKSTTLNAVSGMSVPTAGTIKVDSSQGIGLCPQKNMHWPLLTVLEHVRVLNRLKSKTGVATKAENLQLIRDCDLDRKINAKAGSLSGGQQRKLQLTMMFTGGSKLCLVDEVSSGIDPLARRKIQEILLAERSKRTIIFTSHFLDEADIADQVVIMSKGRIRIDGTGPQVKSSGLYRVHLHHGINTAATPEFPGIDRLVRHDQTVYTVSSAAEVSSLLAKVEELGWHQYHVAGPTIEDAFLQVAEEMVPEVRIDEKGSDSSSEKELALSNGSHIGFLRQAWVLFRKRATVFRRNWIPNSVAFLAIPVASGLVCLFISTYTGAGCSPTDQVSEGDIASLQDQIQNNLSVVVGPGSKLSLSTLQLVGTALGLDRGNASANATAPNGDTFNFANLTKSFHVVNSLDEFNKYLVDNRANVTPGGAYFGDDLTTMAYRGNAGVFLSFIIANVVDIINTNISIAATYSTFDIPWQADQGNTLQFCVYLGLVMCMYPAFFGLYPTLERLRNVRNLHYSNGVRALPLWLAYICFDFMFILVGSAIAIAIFAGVNSAIFWSLGHLFVVFLLYGLCAALFAYVVSLYARSQLAAFAIAAAYQAVSLLLYMIAYLSVFTYSPVNKVDANVLLVHYTLAIIFPSGSFMRGLFVALNELSVNCRAPNVYASSPAEFQAYGAPITYLLLQSLFLFGYLIWWDTGFRAKFQAKIRRNYKKHDSEEHQLEPDVLEELNRVEKSTEDGLKVMHLTKAFGSNVAVQDISFGIQRGEVFGLLGPNGAGKSTTVSCIRGDIQPSQGSGDITIEGVSMLKKKAAARQLLGNCPQFDAMDQLTVLEHLRFYARIRGVKDVEGNVQEVIRGVGLTAFKNRMGNALSGGNKRKLSLGIALMGNPAVMLLDEISSGLDVAAKRILWKTLETVVPGRSIALITHSMEEADRLCRRAGIMAQKMLAIGTTDDLRKQHGNRYHVHILLKSAPQTSMEESNRVLDWIKETFESAEAEEKAFHGQIRFSVPTNEKAGGIARLFKTLESSKDEVGFEYYSVAQTTLEDVFLKIVKKHNVQEENYGSKDKKKIRDRGTGTSRWMMWF